MTISSVYAVANASRVKGSGLRISCRSTKGYSFVHMNFSLGLTATEQQCLAKAYAGGKMAN